VARETTRGFVAGFERRRRRAWKAVGWDWVEVREFR
jgi:hypothetical protein